jgi:hypothetical protein
VPGGCEVARKQGNGGGSELGVASMVSACSAEEESEEGQARDNKERQRGRVNEARALPITLSKGR